MKVIATAKIIAVKIRPFDRPPAPAALLWLIVFLLYQGEAACAQARPRFWVHAGCQPACPATVPAGIVAST
jgi:hypothetical protein